SRYAQCVELDLSKSRGAVPVELFGNQAFPPVGDLPYFITLGPHGFYWFSLERERPDAAGELPSFSVPGSWETLFSGYAGRQFQTFLPQYLADRRWFAQKARRITAVTVTDAIPVTAPGARAGPPQSVFVIVRVDMDSGEPEQYVLTLGFATGEAAEELCRWRPEAILADLHAAGEAGKLFDAVYDPDFTRAMVGMLTSRRTFAGAGRLLGVPTPFRRLVGSMGPDVVPVPVAAEQSNSSVLVGDRAIFKFIRRFEPGINPGVELGRFLGELASFPRSPRVIGSIEYQSGAPSAIPATIGLLEEFVANEGDGWSYLVDALVHGLEELLATSHTDAPTAEPPPRLLDVAGRTLEPGHPLVGPHVEWASLLGRRTAELHHTLVSDAIDPDMAPEALTFMDRQAMFHGARVLARRTFRQAAALKLRSPLLEETLDREAEILARLRAITSGPLDAERIRCHGDYHLGQVLWTGKDFVIIDFEGEPARSLGQRRLKRSAAADLAGMVRSFHYASRVAAMHVTRDLRGSVASVEPLRLEAWLTHWYRWVGGTFLASYFEVSADDKYLPSDRDQLARVLDFFLLEKGIYELSYEANSRPDWVEIPARGILDMLAAAP
ncbi:MAG: putative maltokinase, partial [Acidimicrobiales bacterium]